MKRAVVVGAGVAGLTSAILLAMDGYDVTVCEQHKRAGGLLQRFFRTGTPYDTGFHYCGGIGRDDVFAAALRHLGIFDELNFIPLERDGFDRLVFPSLTFEVPVGLDNYRERLKATFPHEAAGIDLVCDRITDAAGAYGLYSFRPTMAFDRLMALESQSVAEVMRAHVRDPLVRAVLTGQNTLYGVPSTDAPFGLHALVLHHFLQGAYRIEGGGDRLAMRLVARLRALGGRVRFGARATQVLVTDRAATGVVLEGGEALPADVVVFNAHPRSLIPLLPEGAVRPAYVNRVNGTRVGHSWCGLYIEVEGGVPELGNRNLYRYFADDPDVMFTRSEPEDVRFYYASAPGEAPGQARKHDVLLQLVPGWWADVAPWAGSKLGARPPEYAAYKARVTEGALAAIQRDFPELIGRIRRVETSTPLTAQAYTSTPNGAMYGHYHSTDQMGRFRPSQHLRVHDLLLVGQGVASPGVLGAMMSAYYAVGGRVGLERLIDELKAVA